MSGRRVLTGIESFEHRSFFGHVADFGQLVNERGAVFAFPLAAQHLVLIYF